MCYKLRLSKVMCDRLVTANTPMSSILILMNSFSTLQCCIYTLPMLELVKPVLQPAIISFTRIT